MQRMKRAASGLRERIDFGTSDLIVALSGLSIAYGLGMLNPALFWVTLGVGGLVTVALEAR